MTFTFTSDGRCPNCGYQHFTSASNPTEDAPITCLRCKALTVHTDRAHIGQDSPSITVPKKDL